MKCLSAITVFQRDSIIQNEFPALAASRKAKEVSNIAPAVKDAFANAAIDDGNLLPPVKLDKPSYPKQ